MADAEAASMRRSERTGRPLGSEQFLGRLEALLERPLTKQKPGPKKQNEEK